MKIKVHWIIDGIIEVEAESAEDAEKIVDGNLKKYIDDEADLTKKFGAHAIQGKALNEEENKEENEIKKINF